MANIAKAIEPKSDQQNAVDYLTGPRLFTVTGVSDYLDEKRRPKVSVHLAEAPDRPFKPSATNLRLIVIGWGQDDNTWVGRRIKLDLDPEVTFGREKVGGIRVVALSNMEQPFTAKLPTTRGKKAEFRVEKLEDVPAPPPVTDEQATAITEHLAALNVPTVRFAEALSWYAGQVGVTREVNAYSDINRDEADAILAVLNGASA